MQEQVQQKGGRQNPPSFLPAVFFFCAPSFFFFSLEGDFFESPLFAHLFFFLQQFWLQNRVFELFSRIFIHALFFFLLKAPSFFFFLMEVSFFCALFSPSFFFSPSFLLNLTTTTSTIVNFNVFVIVIRKINALASSYRQF